MAQSKIRKAGGNSGDAGPPFDDQTDMFGQRKFQHPLRPLSARGSAHRNSGMAGSLFIPDRRVWETLTDISKESWQRLKESPAAAMDALDRARVNLQDRLPPFKWAQHAIELEMGRVLSESMSASGGGQKAFSGKN